MYLATFARTETGAYRNGDELIFQAHPDYLCRMNTTTLTVAQLKRVAVIRQRIDRLTKELGTLLGPVDVPVGRPGAPNKKRTLSTAARKRISAAQKARWAKL